MKVVYQLMFSNLQNIIFRYVSLERILRYMLKTELPCRCNHFFFFFNSSSIVPHNFQSVIVELSK